MAHAAAPSGPLMLIDILSQYPIFDALCSHLDTPTLFLLRRVSKSFAQNYAAHTKERWNINRRLQHFIQDPKSLRSLLARYNALISGSFVIQFLDAVFWDEADLDIFVYHKHAGAFATHLVEKEGYKFDAESSRGENEENYARGVRRVDTFLLGDRSTSCHRKIQILSTRNIPIESVLGCFYTTTVINAISWNAAYSLFPDMTFAEPRIQCELSAHSREQPAKYLARGWVGCGFDWPSKHKPTSALQLTGSRRVGDSFTWKKELDVADVTPSAVPDYVLENSHFDVRRTHEYTHIVANFARVYTNDALQHEYTHAHFEGGDFWSFAKPRMQELVLVELRKQFTVEELPLLSGPPVPNNTTDDVRLRGLWDTELQDFMDAFVKPKTWTHYDDRIPGWCGEWEKKNADELALNGPMSELDLLRQRAMDNVGN